MREIKFKAIHCLKNGKVALSKPFLINEINCYDSELYGQELYVRSQKGEDVFINYSTELIQFTGLKDKKGKEIYEGDIVKTTNKGKCIIRFDRYLDGHSSAHQGFCLELENEQGFNGLDGSLEVIGNIYQNKELLK
jgi:uncharacterized phage protein (TIGR01671 family)